MNNIAETFADAITGVIIADDVLFFVTIISFLVFIVLVVIIALVCKKNNKKRYIKGIAFMHLLMCSLLSFTSVLMVKWWIAIIICITAIIGVKIREYNELKYLKEDQISFYGYPIIVYAILSALFYLIGTIVVTFH